MNRARAENSVVSFSSFAELAARKGGGGGLRAKACAALTKGQKEAFLIELSGYVDEILGNRILRIREESAAAPSAARSRTVRRFRLVQGGKQ